jgi:hypothetical protein
VTVFIVRLAGRATVLPPNAFELFCLRNQVFRHSIHLVAQVCHFSLCCAEPQGQIEDLTVCNLQLCIELYRTLDCWLQQRRGRSLDRFSSCGLRDITLRLELAELCSNEPRRKCSCPQAEQTTYSRNYLQPSWHYVTSSVSIFLAAAASFRYFWICHTRTRFAIDSPPMRTPKPAPVLPATVRMIIA